jgi:hypothetical protein
VVVVVVHLNLVEGLAVQALLLFVTLVHKKAQVELLHQVAVTQSTPLHHQAHTQRKE